MTLLLQVQYITEQGMMVLEMDIQVLQAHRLFGVKDMHTLNIFPRSMIQAQQILIISLYTGMEWIMVGR